MQVITEQVDNITVVNLQGEALDASNAKDFKTQVAPAIVAGAKLVFDLSNM
jgi:anti-anti-sigma regulatory factor